MLCGCPSCLKIISFSSLSIFISIDCCAWSCKLAPAAPYVARLTPDSIAALLARYLPNLLDATLLNVDVVKCFFNPLTANFLRGSVAIFFAAILPIPPLPKNVNISTGDTSPAKTVQPHHTKLYQHHQHHI